ncbi:MAG: hypothetical protein HFJ09_13300 [Lachnospiraceae bacterium]|nr:hypothetical protein [Lachnospiraceae bacterium]
MQAVKGNKVYTISETEKSRYIAMGYDITEGEEIIAYGKGKTVSYDEYVKIVKENEALKAELEALKQYDPGKEETEKKTVKKTAKE